jgi:hypothetical protein
VRAIDVLDAERDNIRGALAWSVERTEPAQVATGLRLGTLLTDFWYLRGEPAEGVGWLEAIVANAPPEIVPGKIRCRHGLAVLLEQTGRYNDAEDALILALEDCRAIGDLDGVCRELNSLGIIRRARGDNSGGRKAIEESLALARQLGAPGRTATSAVNLALLALDERDSATAIPLLQEAEAIDRSMGDEWAVLVDRVNLAFAKVIDGDPRYAVRSLARDVATLEEIGDRDLLANALEVLAIAAAVLDDLPVSARLSGAAVELRTRFALPMNVADAAVVERELGPARSRLGAAEWRRLEDDGRGLAVPDGVLALISPLL